MHTSPLAIQWLAAAQENAEAATILMDRFPRAAISRYYYAAFGAAHAIVIARKETPPRSSEGNPRNWKHSAIQNLLETNLATKHPQLRKDEAVQFRLHLQAAWQIRLQADYSIIDVVSESDAKRTRENAVSILQLATEIINGNNHDAS